MCVALAVTGIAVANSAESAAAPASAPITSSVSAAPASYTTAARKSALVSHNPRGTSYVHRSGDRAYFHGTATDRDNRGARLVVVLWHNGHKAAVVKTAGHGHRYAVRMPLKYGANHFVLLVRNVGKGTWATQLRNTHMRLHQTWISHYYGAKRIAAQMFKRYGWGENQMQSLINLWNRESGWRTTAANPSGAYGIPQALPGGKMASAGPNWQNDATTQIRWGLGYIAGRYGSPNAAWAHSQATSWY
jgi:hypothetical protein